MIRQPETRLAKTAHASSHQLRDQCAPQDSNFSRFKFDSEGNTPLQQATSTVILLLSMVGCSENRSAH